MRSSTSSSWCRRGRTPAAAVETALHAQGARPFDSADFSTTGMVWGQFSDGTATPSVTQNYNLTNDPTGAGDAPLTATHTTWTAPTSSTFDLDYGGVTDRCPTLVQECDGTQTPDGNNDVAWLALAGGNTLGVTWFMTSGPAEADMALNTAFRWTADSSQEGRETGCRGPSKKCYLFDAQTVFLHENGHVAGLGHSEVSGAAMEPAYEGVRRTLHGDDTDGIAFLYPSGVTPEPSPTPEGGTVSVGPIAYSVSGGRSDDKHLSIHIAVIDDDGNSVSGASVSIRLDLDGKPLAWVGTATTGEDGTVTFTKSNAQKGCYTTDVMDVTADGVTWDEATPANGFCK